MGMPRMRRMAVPRIRRRIKTGPETIKTGPETQAGAEQKLHLESVSWGELTWFNIEAPTKQETEYLAENYPFHPLDLDDCLSRIQRPKIDEYDDYLFLVFHFPLFSKEARVTTPSQVSVFIGQNYLITLHTGELKPLEKLFNQCQNKIGGNIEAVEDNIFSRRFIPRAIEDMSVLRRDVISFRRIIWPMRAVIGRLEPKIRRFTQMDMEVYFGDMTDHVDKIWDVLDEYKEIIEGLSDTHDSLATNRTNEVIRMLTIVATILLPLTVIASIYGMNVPLPFQESGYAFVFVFAIWALVVVGMLCFFRYHRWI